MQWTVVATALGLLLLSGCGASEKRSLHATLEADRSGGSVTMMCTASSSGTCHALFVTGPDMARVSAAVGTSTGTTGISDETRYCLDVNEPVNGCTLKPLAQGEQIVRQQTTAR